MTDTTTMTENGNTVEISMTGRQTNSIMTTEQEKKIRNTAEELRTATNMTTTDTEEARLQRKEEMAGRTIMDIGVTARDATTRERNMTMMDEGMTTLRGKRDESTRIIMPCRGPTRKDQATNDNIAMF